MRSSVTGAVFSLNTGTTANIADLTVNSGAVAGGEGTLDGGGAGSALDVKSGAKLVGTGAGLTVNEYDQITLEAGSQTLGTITFQSTVPSGMITVNAGARPQRRPQYPNADYRQRRPGFSGQFDRNADRDRSDNLEFTHHHR